MQKKLIIILGVASGIVLILFLATMWRERQLLEQGEKEVVTQEEGLPENEEENEGFFMDEAREDNNDGSGQTAPPPPSAQQIQEAALTLLGKSYLVQLGMTQVGANNTETEVVKKILEMDLDYTAIATVNLQSIQMEAAANSAQFQVIVSDSRELLSSVGENGQPIQTAVAQTYQARVQFVAGGGDIASFEWERVK